MGLLSTYSLLKVSLFPRPHPLIRKNGLGNQAKFLGLAPRQFLAGRCVWAGHEGSLVPI